MARIENETGADAFSVSMCIPFMKTVADCYGCLRRRINLFTNVCVHAYVSRSPWKLERGVRCLRAEIVLDSEPSRGAGG